MKSFTVEKKIEQKKLKTSGERGGRGGGGRKFIDKQGLNVGQKGGRRERVGGGGTGG